MQSRTRHPNDAGFTLPEVLVALTLLIVAVAGLARLSAVAVRTQVQARVLTETSALAFQKMEQLRSLAWGFDAAAQPLSDVTTDLTVFPDRSGGPGLQPAPGGTLDANVTGYCDFVDRFGRSLGGGSAPPSGAVYVRRWKVTPLSADPANTVVLQVRTLRVEGAAAAGAGSADVALACIRSRMAG